MPRKSVSYSSHSLLRHDQKYRDEGFISLAGVDEAGRGPLAGPVVASAVIVRDFSFTQRIDDSKKMTPLQRAKALREIRRKCTVGIGIVDVETIDRVNILRATLLAMQKAVHALEVLPDCILVDGTHAPEVATKRIAIVDGDALSFSIACASIAAKVTRDMMMKKFDRQYPQYGFAQHKGYGTEHHLERLRAHGPCEIHRKSFEWKRS